MWLGSASAGSVAAGRLVSSRASEGTNKVISARLTAPTLLSVMGGDSPGGVWFTSRTVHVELMLPDGWTTTS